MKHRACLSLGDVSCCHTRSRSRLASLRLRMRCFGAGEPGQIWGDALSRTLAPLSPAPLSPSISAWVSRTRARRGSQCFVRPVVQRSTREVLRLAFASSMLAGVERHNIVSECLD